jgi:peroxin-3
VSLAAPQKEGPGIRLENRDDDSFETAYGNDFDTNRKYLSLSWWLLHRGYKEIMDMVNKAVKEVFGPINPREDLTLERLSELIVDVRKKVEGATVEERRSDIIRMSSSCNR